MPTIQALYFTGCSATGSPLVTSSLTESDTYFQSGESVTSHTYQWYRASTSGSTGSAIPGATSTTYTTSASDLNLYVYCHAMISGSAGDNDAIDSNRIGPIYENVPANTGAPSVTPTTPQNIGTTLSSTTGSWSSFTSPSFTYQWYRNSSAIGGATGSSYTLVSADYANTVACVVTAQNTHGASAAGSNGVVAHSVTPVNTVPAAISGTKQVGSTLSTTNGTWDSTYAPTPSSFTYQWQRDGHGDSTYANIGSATSATYALVDADDGCNTRCQITAHSAGGNTTEPSAGYGLIVEPAPTNSVAPVASGTARVGVSLSSTQGTWAHMGGYLPSFTYQWQRDNHGGGIYSNIAGANASGYTLTDSEDGCHVRSTVLASNTGGNLQINSTALGVVVEPAPVNTTAPTISGAPSIGIGLSASTGTWSNMGGNNPSFTYQWQSSPDGTTWTNITGAATYNYAPVTADQGKFLRCVVAAHNSGSP